MFVVILGPFPDVVRPGDLVGQQHQGMDRPGVRQVPEGSGEQKKKGKKKVVKSSMVLQPPPAAKG